MRLKSISILLLFCHPVLAEESLRERGSADLLAEIEFLKTLVPEPRPLNGADARAVEGFLAATATCNDFSFAEYEEFVAGIEVALSSRTNLGLGERSFRLRKESGCSIDETERVVAEGYLGDFELRSKALGASAKRNEEMIRRTLTD